MNNARILTFGGMVPLYDLEEVDADTKLWKGKPLPAANVIKRPGMRLDDSPEESCIYFSRRYEPEVNDLDKIFQEIEITSLDVLDHPFWLIPKDKLLFAYEPPSTIVKPGQGVVKLIGPEVIGNN